MQSSITRKLTIAVCVAASLYLTACTSLSSRTKVPRASLAQGKESFAAGNYSLAFKQLMPFAVHGYRDAEYAVAYMYYYGKGVESSEEIGSSWLCRAENKGQGDAQTMLQEQPQIDCKGLLSAYTSTKKRAHK